ncbi:Ficolin-2 [Holothuria leucospilota]|uniref:Ficolin-2 n=1 Tax=Holothuria leucospilota TaxID=206669 RepID=A0A9Q1BUJ9_HOLLE|nr:Ficolin-2 [Holothuria leucospilota]
MNPQLRGVSAIFTFIVFVGKFSLTLCNEGTREGRSVAGNLGSSYFFYQHPEYPKDCMDVFNQCSGHNASGVYVIKPDGYPEPFEVYCDNEKHGGGWTVIQRRQNESIKFDRQWKDYKEGFGFLSSEFWLGNEKVAFLTNQRRYQLRLDLENSNGKYFLVYDVFRIGDEWSNYTLNLTGYSGTAENSVTICPTNMKYDNCSCQATCDDPQGCGVSCSEEEACICADGFLKKGQDCVPPQSCDCYVQGEGILRRDTMYVNSDCTRRCNCTASGLSCDSVYRCDVNAVCEERDNVRQCYCNEGYAGDGQTCTMDTFTDCQDVYNAGHTDSDVYTIQPINSPQPFEVYCNMSDGGGWTVFQRRIDGDVDFYRDWNEYKQGFGSRDDEFWLGNDNLYYLTNQQPKNYELRIDLVNRYGSPYYAKYTLFRISDKDDLYRLVGLGTYSGTAGYDALNYHRNMAFTTKDSDNDANSVNCAVYYHGAWWYKSCSHSDINGNYHGSGWSSISWYNLPGGYHNIKFTEMKVRPVQND